MFTVQLFNRDVVYRPFAFAIVLTFGLSLAPATPTYLRPDRAVASNISRSAVFCHTRSKFFRSLASAETCRSLSSPSLRTNLDLRRSFVSAPTYAFAERNVPQLWWPPTVS